MEFIKHTIKLRVIRYLISGGSAAVTDLAALFVLVEFFHVWYIFAAVLAFIVAVYVSFMMQKFFTFNDQTKEKIKFQAVFYLGFQLLNLGLNTLLMYISVEKFNIHYLFAQVFVTGTIAIYSYFVYKYLVFKPDTSYNNQDRLLNSIK